jgi:hypothetical protein
MQTYKRYVVYSKTNGKIRRTLQSTDVDIAANHDMQTEAYIEGSAHVLDDYVVDGEVRPRPQMETTLTPTTDGCTLSNLPAPCILKINCTDYPCETTEEDIVFDQPGTYEIKITAWPYHDKEFTYEYTAS